MKPKNTIIIVVAVIAAIIVGWNLFRPAGGTGIVNVDAAGVTQAISGGARVIDVRSPGEYQLGHLPGAVNVPIDQFQSQAQSLDRGLTYVVYCATGARSASAVDIMKGLGFTSVKHFASGIQAWPGELEKGEATSSQTIPTSGKPVFVEFYTDS